MLVKTRPENEGRLKALRSFDVLDTGTEKIYDDITELTAAICEVPICLVSLVEEDRQWFKSAFGFSFCETSLDKSICAHAVRQDRYLEIIDTHLDERTINNPLCRGERPIRFYAGAVLRSLSGFALGTLCVLDYQPRTLTELQRRTLDVHATSIMQQLELTRALIEDLKTVRVGSIQTASSQKLNEYDQKAKSRFETLTPREREIMKLFADRSGSLSSKDVAKELSISPRTVDHHRASIMAKMEVNSIAELIAVSLRAGILR